MHRVSRMKSGSVLCGDVCVASVYLSPGGCLKSKIKNTLTKLYFASYKLCVPPRLLCALCVKNFNAEYAEKAQSYAEKNIIW